MPTRKHDQSLVDILVQLVPGLKGLLKEQPSPKLANMLFNKVWANETLRLAGRKYKVPSDIPKAEIEAMAKAGLVAFAGRDIEITDKGSKIIIQMVLGNPRSALEEGPKEAEYLRALANLKPQTQKLASRRQDGGDDWFSRSNR